MSKLKLALVGVVAAAAVTVGSVAPSHVVEARTCDTTTGKWSTMTRCWDADEQYRRCLRSTTYRIVCGGWRVDFNQSIAAIPCCSPGNTEVIAVA